MEKRILIIDDDVDILSLFADILEDSGFGVKCVSETHGVFNLITDFKPDIVLLDYFMRDVNGGDICSEIKTNDRTAHLPVVLMSAYPGVLQSMGSYGCDAFIEKPFDIDDMVNCLNGVIKFTAQSV